MSPPQPTSKTPSNSPKPTTSSAHSTSPSAAPTGQKASPGTPAQQACSPPAPHATQSNRGASGVHPARQTFLPGGAGSSPRQPHDPKPLKPFRLGDKKPPQTSTQVQTKKAVSTSKDLQRAGSKPAINDEVPRVPVVHNGSRPARKKSLVIGINYVGSQHELEGCHQDVHNVREFLQAVGYSDDQQSQVVMRDDQYTDPRGPYWPTGDNMLAAMDWLISESGTVNFLHYSGHGGQLPSDDYRTSGFDATIVPVDYETQGQIPSGVLHQALVTKLPTDSTLFIVFDCCHSGSAVELPYVYRTDQDGNVNLLDNVEAGMRLIGSASHLLQNHLSKAKIGEAKSLLAGATDFFKGLTHQQASVDQYGLDESDTMDSYASEGAKNVWMYSGCRDDQTSADASIQGSHVGAMSWAFLNSMKEYGPQQTFVQVLQHTRQLLKGNYAQVPQLSVGADEKPSAGLHCNLTKSPKAERMAPKKRKRSPEQHASDLQAAELSQHYQQPFTIRPSDLSLHAMHDNQTPRWYKYGPRSEYQLGPLIPYAVHAATLRERLDGVAADRAKLESMYADAYTLRQRAKKQLELHELHKPEFLMARKADGEDDMPRIVEWEKTRSVLRASLVDAERDMEKVEQEANARRLRGVGKGDEAEEAVRFLH
ncbi:metacaspase [Hortaea werneckii]|nr:metacaspase [Hortaea werneckii]